MRKTLTAACLAATVAAGCTGTASDDQIAGALIGGAIAGITADAIGSSEEWIIAATLAGATAGTLVARNRNTGRCAYANGDGTYYTAPCRR